MDVPYTFWVYRQNRGRLQMAPCVYLNWHVGIGAEMEEVKPPEASLWCACTHVRVTACVCTCCAVTLMSISVRTCAPLFDVRLGLCLDKWTAASSAACRASDHFCLWSGCSRPGGGGGPSHFVGECQTPLPAPTADMRHWVQCISGHNQSASLTGYHLLFLFLFFFFLFIQHQVDLHMTKCRW